uniref:Uncharacterized protein n=1 Tax=Kalanchoe fedtschenkoi TaxID=63787 RepID=A0A7N0TMH2_KALFE
MEKMQKEMNRRMNKLLQLVFILIAFASPESSASSSSFSSRKLLADEAPPLKLITGDQQVTVDNGLFSATFSVPEGMINEIRYNGISNLLSENEDLNSRMYFDAVSGKPPAFRIDATKYNVTVQTDEQVELSFTYTWDAKNSSVFPVNVEKRYVVLRGFSGIYIYGIYERLKGWPDMDFVQTRIVFKPNGDK